MHSFQICHQLDVFALALKVQRFVIRWACLRVGLCEASMTETFWDHLTSLRMSICQDYTYFKWFMPLI